MKLSIVLALLLAAAGLPAVAAEKTAFYLHRASNWEINYGGKPYRGFLSRELARQAVLIAAREELGLTIRDHWLGDAPPPEKLGVFHDLKATAGEPNIIELLAGTRLDEKSIGKFDLPATGKDVLDLPRLAVTAEALSRKQIPELLVAAGYTRGERVPAKASADVPEAIEKLLARMTPPAQFDAVRQLHVLIAKEGESPERLAALARGYANLGLLTEELWHPLHQSFKARALLYAQRAVQAFPEQAELTLAGRAYVLSLLSLHAAALDDVKAIEAAQAKAGEAKPHPAWLQAAVALARFDDQHLGKMIERDEAADLARLLLFVAAESWQSRQRTTELGQQLLPQLVESWRVGESAATRDSETSARMGGRSAQHLAATIYARVAAVHDVPPRVRELVAPRVAHAKREGGRAGWRFNQAETDDRAALIRELRYSAALNRESGRDAAGLSWATLSLIVREVSFLHAVRALQHFDDGVDEARLPSEALRAEFPLRKALEVSLPDELDFRPDHASDRREQATKELVAAIDRDAADLRLFPLYLMAEMYEQGAAAGVLIKLAFQQTDDVARELPIALEHVQRPATRTAMAQSLHRLSPYSPMGRALLVQYDWKTVEPHAAAWEAEAQRHSVVLTALAAKYSSQQQYAAAVRCLTAAGQSDPSPSTSLSLATAYKKLGQTERWLEALEQVVTLPEEDGAKHTAHVELCYHFCGLRQWDHAQKHAEQAALGSRAGLMALATVHECRQDWAKADELFKSIGEYGGDGLLQRFLYCKRTGRTGVERTQAAALAALGAKLAAPDQDNYRNAFVRLLSGQTEEALKHLDAEFARSSDPHAGLHAALLADQAGDEKARDERLRQVLAKGLSYQDPLDDNAKRPELVDLARLLIADLKAGGKAELDREAWARLRKSAGGLNRARLDYLLGAYCDLHGAHDAAVEHWVNCMVDSDLRAFSRTLAGAALWDRGFPPSTYKAKLRGKPAGK